MSRYDELIKALRLCQFGECGCGKCYYKELKGDWCTEDNHPEFFDCDDKLKLDAAAAIEALEEDNADLNETVSSLIGMLKSFREEPIQVGKTGNKYTLNEPKRGKWIHSVSVQGTTSGGIIYHHGYTCSVCGGLMGRKGDAYCYNCGAKMEVQE